MSRRKKTESPELQAIRRQVIQDHDHREALGLSWLLNPEQEKLRRELPFIADALDVCLNYVRQESLDALERKLMNDPKPFTSKAIRRQEQWAKHNEQRRLKARHNNRPHDPRTGKFLPKEAS